MKASQSYQWRMGHSWLLTLPLLMACGSQESRPDDTLSLRDALRNEPEVLASLPFETRYELAVRFDAAAKKQEERTWVVDLDKTTIDSLSIAVDEAREDSGDDVLVMAQIALEGPGWVIHHASIDDSTGEAQDPPVLEEGIGAVTAAWEGVALRGRGGREVTNLFRHAQTRQIVRTTGLPIGVWAWNETLYVNASWLVALSAFDETARSNAPESEQRPLGNTPGIRPLTVDANPYHLPESLFACSEQVTSTCRCGAACPRELSDSTFSDVFAECAWTREDPMHATALCALVLMRIEGMKHCMESVTNCPSMPVLTRNDAVAFVQDPDCFFPLDSCLNTGTASPSDETVVDEWDGFNCSGCECSRSGATSRCCIEPQTGSFSWPPPMAPAFWLSLPAACLLLRRRRRS